MGEGPTPKLVFDASLVRKLASLSRLALTAEEETQLASELTRVLAYVDELAAVDLTDVAPSTWAIDGGARLRHDDPKASLGTALALREAPRADDDAFLVPGFVDEG